MDVLCHAYWLSGRIAMQTGLMDTAEHLARLAVDLGTRVKGDHRCLSDASRLLQEVLKARLRLSHTDA
jgi:hypothetical protein